MKHLVVYTHPNPESFCHAILETVQSALADRGDEVIVSDIYKKNFSPVLSSNDFIAFGKGEVPEDILEEQKNIAWADNIIFIYPTWWFSRPAMLQGWIDRVFSHGFAFIEDENGFEALLSGKTSNLFVTYGGREEDVVEAFGSIDNAVSSMTIGTLGLVGIAPVKPLYCFEVPTTTDEKRKSMLNQVAQTLNS